ncbi:MAG: CARDB domain-containing protein [Candidatus Aenigmatarchaeota archaeon]
MASYANAVHTIEIIAEENTPDLVIESISIEQVTVGNARTPAYRYTVYVKNVGTTDAARSRLRMNISPKQPQAINDGAFYICYGGSNAPIPMNDLVAGDVLHPGEHERYTDYFNPAYAGSVTITATADYYGAVDELDEGNNALSQTFSVDKLVDTDVCPAPPVSDKIMDIWMWTNGTKALQTTPPEYEEHPMATATTKIYVNDALGKQGLDNKFQESGLYSLVRTNSIGYKYNVTFSSSFYIPSYPDSHNYRFSCPQIASKLNPSLLIDACRIPDKDRLEITTPYDSLYQTVFKFDESMDRSEILGGTFHLFGRNYTVMPDTNFADVPYKLALMRHLDTATMKEGETVTVKAIDGSAVYVKLNSVLSTKDVFVTTGSGSGTVSLNQVGYVGNTYIYVDDITYYGDGDARNRAILSIGDKMIVLEDEKKARVTMSRWSPAFTEIDGTNVSLYVNSNKFLWAFIFTELPETNSKLTYTAARWHLPDGHIDRFTDPVWETFGLEFKSISGTTVTTIPSSTTTVETTIATTTSTETTISAPGSAAGPGRFLITTPSTPANTNPVTSIPATTTPAITSLIVNNLPSVKLNYASAGATVTTIQSAITSLVSGNVFNSQILYMWLSEFLKIFLANF